MTRIKNNAIKRIAAFALAVFLLLFCVLSVSADETEDELLEQSGAKQALDTLPNEARELMHDMGADGMESDNILELNASDILSRLLELLHQRATRPLRTCCAIIGIILIYTMLQTLKSSTLSDTLSRSFATASVLCTAGIVIAPITQLISECNGTVESCGIFLEAYIPAFGALLAFSSMSISSAVYSSLLFGASQAVSVFSKNIIIPLTVICFAISLICAVSHSVSFKGLSEGLSKTVTWSLGLMMTLYVGLMTIQGAVGSSADSVALKSAKFFASSALPVVGGAVSEAMSSVFTGLSLVKASVGSIGIIAIATFFLPCIAELLCWKLLLGLCSAISEITDDKKIGGVLSSASSTVTILLAVTVCYALIIIICTALMIKTSNGL